MKDKKTHKVIDLVYHNDEGNDVFCGTYDQCIDFISQQGDSVFTYQIVPMAKEEIEIENNA